jgi:hypothetical protein
VINSLGERSFLHKVPLGANAVSAEERRKKGLRVPANFLSNDEKKLANQALIRAKFNAALAKRAEEAAAAAEAERLRAAFIAGLTRKQGGGGKRTLTRKQRKRANKRKTRRYHS